uniref:Uncharacterized protein n=1 Tax=Cyprinus carpio carpio TaxID=630221 RepID=A0A9J8AL07_CYPCA
MDRHKRKPLDPGVSEREADLCSSVLSLLLTSLQCLLFSICASVPFLPLQYVTFILQVNIILTVLTLLAFILPFYVFLHCRELAKQRENSQSILEDSIQETSMYS